MKKQQYYKIVSVRNNKLYSSVPYNNKICVEYDKPKNGKPGKWVSPKIKNSLLFVFTAREAARVCKRMQEKDFCEDTLYIYKADVINPRFVKYVLRYCFYHTQIKEFWRQHNPTRFQMFLDYFLYKIRVKTKIVYETISPQNPHPQDKNIECVEKLRLLERIR